MNGEPRPPVRRYLVEATGGLPGPAVVGILIAVGILYPLIGRMWTPLLQESLLATALLTVLAVLTVAGILIRPTTDRFELFRAMSFYFFMSFCFSTLIPLHDVRWFYERPIGVLMERSAALALMAYVCAAIGYHLPFFRPIPRRLPDRSERIDPKTVKPLAFGLLGVGILGFAALFVFAGGAAVIIGGQGGLSRNEFTKDIGIFFWLSMFMVPAAASLFAAQLASGRRPVLLQAWPLLLAFVLLALLQGRHRALGPLIVALVISHYLARRVRVSRMFVLGTIGMIFAILVGVVRSPTMRPIFAEAPLEIGTQVLARLPEHAQTLAGTDIGRVTEVMVVVDKIPADVPYFGGSTLLNFFDPFLRQLGLDHLQAPLVGFVLYYVARPELNTIVRTGFLPSIVGEMRANFPWWLCPIPYLIWGILLRWIYQALIVKRGDFMAVAAYAIIGLAFCNMVIGTFAQNMFEHMVVLVPVLALRFVATRRPPGPALSAEPLAEPSTHPGAPR